MTAPADLETRLEQLEAESALRQLVARYALAVDSRNLAGVADLFCTDVDCGRWGSGRPALIAFYDGILRRFGRTLHTVANHVIDLRGERAATGIVSCKAEHEVDDEWVVQALCYFDDYERQDGHWLFRRRRVETFYVNDVLARPGQPDYVQNTAVTSVARLPELFPTWADFWSADPPKFATECLANGKARR